MTHRATKISFGTGGYWFGEQISAQDLALRADAKEKFKSFFAADLFASPLACSYAPYDPDVLIHAGAVDPLAINKFSYLAPHLYVAQDNISPDWRFDDAAISFDADSAANLHSTYHSSYLTAAQIATLAAPSNPEAVLAQKTKFCAFVYQNITSDSMRRVLFKGLNRLLRVDSLGGFYRNLPSQGARFSPDWLQTLLAIYKSYKFVIAVENIAQEGYHSEKIWSAYAAHSVPIYFGDSTLARYYNPDSYIDARDFDNEDSLANYVLQLHNDDARYLRYLRASPYTQEQKAYWLGEAKRREAFLRHALHWRGASKLQRTMLTREVYSRLGAKVFLYRQARDKDKDHRTSRFRRGRLSSEIYSLYWRKESYLERPPINAWGSAWQGRALKTSEDLTNQELVRVFLPFALDSKNPRLFIDRESHELERLGALKYLGKRWLHTGENRRWTNILWDYTLSPNTTHAPHNLDIAAMSRYRNRRLEERSDNKTEMNKKTKRCVFLYSNWRCETRNRFYELLSRHWRIDSYGAVFRNQRNEVARTDTQWQQESERIYLPYRFSVSFENSAGARYVSEKIYASLWSGCVPIYWGAAKINDYINPECFINAYDFDSLESLARYVLRVDAEPALYEKYLYAPIATPAHIKMRRSVWENRKEQLRTYYHDTQEQKHLPVAQRTTLNREIFTRVGAAGLSASLRDMFHASQFFPYIWRQFARGAWPFL